MKHLLAILAVFGLFAVAAPDAQADCKRTITLTNTTASNVRKVKASTRPQVGVFTTKKKWSSAPIVAIGGAMKIQVKTDVGCDFKVKWKVEYLCNANNSFHTYCTIFTENRDIKKSLPKNACDIGWTNC